MQYQRGILLFYRQKKTQKKIHFSQKKKDYISKRAHHLGGAMEVEGNYNPD